MRLCHLKIERFRGIKSVEWTVREDFLCLIGPGHSTKSTIVDAIELAPCRASGSHVRRLGFFRWRYRATESSDGVHATIFVAHL
jgi:recombinational DNA repair ATPase RecF